MGHRVFASSWCGSRPGLVDEEGESSNQPAKFECAVVETEIQIDTTIDDAEKVDDLILEQVTDYVVRGAQETRQI